MYFIPIIYISEIYCDNVKMFINNILKMSL